jgi:NADH-quinone oxidoreductase subunit L
VENVLVADPHHFHFDWTIAIISTIFAGAGLLAAMRVWSGDAAMAREAREKYPMAHALFVNKFYLDDVYQWIINNVALALGRFIAFFDRVVINDTGVDGPGDVANGSSFLLKLQQTGKLPNYALAMVIGVLVLAIVGFSVKG